MKHLTKRALSLLLAALMVLSLIPAIPHAHAEGETEIVYGANWEYAVTKTDAETGEVLEDYRWLQGVFKTEDTDYIYGTSYDWSVTLSPTKASATVDVEATIQDESNTEVARVTKTLDVAKGPATTTVLSHTDFTEQMAGKTGNFLLTVNVYWNGRVIAQLKVVFGYTGNASDNEGAGDSGDQGGEETPTLGEKWEFHSSYTWLNTSPNYCKFITAETDYIYEEGKAYDWSVVMKQGRTNVPLTVDATIVDENGSLVASVSNKAVTANKGQESVMLSAADMAGLSVDKTGVFLLECIVKVGSTAAARVQVRFSRTGAAGGEEYVAPAVGTVVWQYANAGLDPETNEMTTYEWVTGAFQVGGKSNEAITEADVIYAGTEAYDWKVTIAPTKIAGTANIVAEVVNENGEVVSTCSKSVEFAKGPATTTVLSAEDFPELTTGLNGTFTVKCIIGSGSKNFAQVEATIQRIADADIDARFMPAKEAYNYESSAAYDWYVAIRQNKADAVASVHAKITDAFGVVVDEITKENVSIPKGLEPTTVLTVADFDAQKLARGGSFKLECDIIHNDKVMATVVGHFTTKCNHPAAAQEVVPGKAADCTNFGMTDGKKCKDCGEITEAQTKIDAEGHDTYDVEAREEATCTTAGKTAHVKCRNCDYEKLSTEIPVRTEHLPGAEATCLAPQTCIHCPEVVIKDKLNHIYSVNDGKCMNGCGKSKCEYEGHDWAEATCTAPKTCKICKVTEGEAVGHYMYEIVAAVAATCTTPGKTPVLSCITCGVTIGGKELAALGHNYVAGICSDCGVWNESAGTTVSVIASQDVLYWGDTVTFTISISPVEHCYNGGFMFEYDKEIFEYVSGQALVSGYSTAGVSDAAGKLAGYFLEGDETVKGAVFQVTFRVKENATFGDTVVSGTPSFTMKVDGVKENVVCEVSAATVNIACRHSFGDWIEIDEVWHKHICTICSYEETILVEYDVTFQYADGTVIEVVQYHYGDVVVAPDAPPAQAPNFAFIGWDKQIEICTGNAIYTAIFEEYVPGDMDGDGVTDHNDAIYLLLNIMFGDANYPLGLAPADLDGNGVVEQEDAVFLLLHSLFGEAFYPLNRGQ